jgi:phage major head subunit gpT-like protein
MDLTNETLDSLATEVVASVYAGEAEAQTWHQEVSMEMPSTTKSSTLSMAVDPTMPVERPRDTPRHIHYVQRGSHEIVNVTWDKVMGIHRHDLEDDIHSGAMIRELISTGFSAGGKFATHKDVLAADVLIQNPTCVDGKTLFHQTHNINPFNADSETFPNEYGSMPLSAENLARAMGLIGKVKGPDGTPMHLRIRKLLVPSMLTARAEHLTSSTQINGTDNPMARKGIMVVTAPELMSQTGYTDGDEAWYAVCSVGNAMAKAPIIYQKRQALRVVSRFSPTDPHVFDMNEYLWGAEERGQVAAGYPYTIFRCRPGALS